MSEPAPTQQRPRGVAVKAGRPATTMRRGTHDQVLGGLGPKWASQMLAISDDDLGLCHAAIDLVV
jgi:hypothetical protein